MREFRRSRRLQLGRARGEPESALPSCGLNEFIPDLSHAGALEAWHRLEVAKRRLLYTLMGLGLPLDGLAFS